MLKCMFLSDGRLFKQPLISSIECQPSFSTIYLLIENFITNHQIISFLECLTVLVTIFLAFTINTSLIFTPKNVFSYVTALFIGAINVQLNLAKFIFAAHVIFNEFDFPYFELFSSSSSSSESFLIYTPSIFIFNDSGFNHSSVIPHTSVVLPSFFFPPLPQQVLYFPS